MWLEQFYDDIDQVIFYVFCAGTGLVALLAVIGLFLQLCSKVKPMPGESIDLSIQVGAILLCVTVLIRGIKSTTSFDTLEILCDVYPALLLVGLTQFVGGLFVKAWSVYLYNTFNRDAKKPRAEEWKPNLWMWFLMVVVAAIIIVWAVLFEPELVNQGKDTMTCTSDRVFEWRTASSVWHAFLLFLAVVAVPMNCYVHPNAQVTLLSLIIFNTLFCTVAGVVAYYTYESTTDKNSWDYAISGGLIMWASFFANLITVVGKFTGRRSDDGDEEKPRPGSEQYATIDSRRKSAQTEYTEMTEQPDW